MRLLALRGENLASLAAPFAVDFEAEPLRGAGIFTISGPTGAGKSTLLDAVCLALYDSLPRMISASGRVGRLDGPDDIAYNDVKGVLRAQCGSGFAEVDFVGQDAGRYRARWEVRRARGRATGRLQKQTMSLIDLTSGARLGDKKTEVLARIQDKVGLTFEQFRRSVLLAQGEFDSFIKADAKERALLLEKITGTQLYSVISQKTFERARAEELALTTLREKLGQQLPLDPAARAQAEDSLAVAEQRDQALEERRARHQRAVDWHEQRARAVDALAAADAEVAAARQQMEEAADRRAGLCRAQAAFALRAELTGQQAAERQGVEAQQRLARQQQETARLAAQEESLLPAFQASAAAAQAASQAYDAVGPELDKAQKLETELTAARQAENSRRDAEAAAQATQQQAEKALADNQQRQQQLGGEEQALRLWLKQQAELEALWRELARLREEVAARQQQQQALQQLDAEAEALTARLADQAAELAGLEAARAAGLAELAGLEQAEQSQAAELAQGSLLVLEEDSSRLTTFWRDLEALQGADQSFRKALQDQAQARQAAEALATRLQQGAAALGDLAEEAPLAKARLDEAQGFYQRSQQSQSDQAEVLRRSLVEGQPCPVCGSTAHPLEQLTTLQQTQLAAEAARVAALAEEVSALQARKAALAAEQTVDRRSQPEGQRRLDSAAAELARWQAVWRRRRDPPADLPENLEALLRDLAPTLRSETPSQAEILRDLLAGCEAARQGVAQRLRHRHEQEQALARAVAARRALQARLAQDKKALEEIGQSQAQHTAQAALITQQRAQAARELSRLETALDQRLSGWLPDWRDWVAARLLSHCQTQAQAWRDGNAQLDRLTDQLVTLRRQGDVLASQQRAASKQALDSQQALLVAQQARQAKQQARQQVISGRSVEQVRREYQQAAADAARRGEAARKALDICQRDLSVGRAQVAQTDADLRRVQQEGEAAESQLAPKLLAAGLARQEALALAAKGDAWLRAEAEALQNLEQNLRRAGTRQEERQHHLQRHDASDQRPQVEAADLAAQKAALAAEKQATRDALLQAQTLLRQDEARRQAAEQLRGDIETRQEKQQVWSQLKDLIGSRDGARFRNFAQSLTLNHLIAQANQHLMEIYPRYELIRVEGDDLLLHVMDHDLADELRAVHSLSGGERFLVSLSLALGLASLSSGQGLRIDSLFIDEGFGSLDQTSLDLALSALENLQASGRRIGVISHVAALKERIAVKVLVSPQGGGASRVRVEAA